MTATNRSTMLTVLGVCLVVLGLASMMLMFMPVNGRGIGSVISRFGLGICLLFGGIRTFGHAWRIRGTNDKEFEDVLIETSPYIGLGIAVMAVGCFVD